MAPAKPPKAAEGKNADAETKEPPPQPRAIRRIKGLVERKKRGRDPAEALRLSSASAEPSPQSYAKGVDADRGVAGGKFGGGRTRPKEAETPGPGAYGGQVSTIHAAAARQSGAFGGGRPALFASRPDEPGPGAHDVTEAEATLRTAVLAKMVTTSSRFHADEVDAQRRAVLPSPAQYVVGDYLAHTFSASITGREGLRSFSDEEIRRTKWYRDRVDILPVGPEFAMYFKRPTQAIQRCKHEQERCSYGRAAGTPASARTTSTRRP